MLASSRLGISLAPGFTLYRVSSGGRCCSSLVCSGRTGSTRSVCLEHPHSDHPVSSFSERGLPPRQNAARASGPRLSATLVALSRPDAGAPREQVALSHVRIPVVAPAGVYPNSVAPLGTAANGRGVLPVLQSILDIGGVKCRTDPPRRFSVQSSAWWVGLSFEPCGEATQPVSPEGFKKSGRLDLNQRPFGPEIDDRYPSKGRRAGTRDKPRPPLEAPGFHHARVPASLPCRETPIPARSATTDSHSPRRSRTVSHTLPGASPYRFAQRQFSQFQVSAASNRTTARNCRLCWAHATWAGSSNGRGEIHGGIWTKQ